MVHGQGPNYGTPPPQPTRQKRVKVDILSLPSELTERLQSHEKWMQLRGWLEAQKYDVDPAEVGQVIQAVLNYMNGLE
jgi:hypothetical protein